MLIEDVTFHNIGNLSLTEKIGIAQNLLWNLANGGEFQRKDLFDSMRTLAAALMREHERLVTR